MPPSQPVATAAHLLPGQVYRVTAPFTDFDGILHPVGETWRFISKSFVPYHDGLALTVEQNGQQRVIRFLWQPEGQAEIIERFNRYVKAVGGAPHVGARVRSRRPLWASLAIGAAVMAGIACLVLFGGIYYFLDALTYRPKPLNIDVTGIMVEIKAPISVSVGEDFNLTVTVSNSNDQPVPLHSLVINANTMDAVTLQRSDPAFLKVTPFQQNGDFLRYDFQQQIPANGRLDIQYALTGLTLGTYQGQVWVCTKTEQNCTLHPWMLIVK